MSWLEKGKKVFEYVKDNPIAIVELAMGIAGLRGA
jgi:hypothetical protein